MKKLIILLLLIFKTNFVLAQTFESPVIIDPPNPMVRDTIRVGLFTTFYPPCLILPQQNHQGISHLFDFDNTLPGYPENHIDLIVVTMTQPICNPFPVTPAPREYYELGTLEEGDYSLQTGFIGRSTILPPPPHIIPFAYGDIITFSVTAPEVIDTVSIYGLVLLSILIFLTLFFFHRE